MKRITENVLPYVFFHFISTWMFSTLESIDEPSYTVWKCYTEQAKGLYDFISAAFGVLI